MKHLSDWVWVLIALIVFGLAMLLCSTVRAQTGVYVHGFCESDGEMLANVTVYIDRKVGWQWQTLPRSSTTNVSGYWGISVPVSGVNRLRLRAVAPREYRLFGARFPGGFQARYIPGVGIELPPPGGQAGNFAFLFTCQEVPSPTPTATPVPTEAPRPTMTPFPGVEEWTDPPQTLENVVVEESLQLVASWLQARDEMYQYAYNKGLGCFPVQGPNRFMFTDVFGETWSIEYCLYPRGWLVWRDIRWPNKIRATKVMDPFWW